MRAILRREKTIIFYSPVIYLKRSVSSKQNKTDRSLLNLNVSVKQYTIFRSFYVNVKEVGSK